MYWHIILYVWWSLIGCSWILISPRTSCLIVISTAHLNERKHSGRFHVVIATSLGSAVWKNFLVFASARGGRENGVDREPPCVGTCMCVFVCARGRGRLFFCRCNSSSPRFPTLLFSPDVGLCSCVSSHVVISALLWRCGPTAQQYFPPQSMPEPLLIPSLRFLLLRVGLHVAMFSFQSLYVHAKKRRLPTQEGQTGSLKKTRLFWVDVFHFDHRSISIDVSVALHKRRQIGPCTFKHQGRKKSIMMKSHPCRRRGSEDRCLTLCCGVLRLAQTDVRFLKQCVKQSCPP